MKIVFPLAGDGAEGQLGHCFGRAATLLVYNSETDGRALLANPAADARSGAGLTLTEQVVALGAVVMVARACGVKALHAFARAGVKVYLTDNPGVEDALEDMRRGDLRLAAPV